MTTTWQVDRVVRVVDGDSVRLVRSRVTQLGDDWFVIRDVDELNGVPIRLVHVDTPERGELGYAQARDDLAYWIGLHRGSGLPTRLTVVCHYRDAFGRMLGDLVDGQGESASQWLMQVKGWAPYGGAA